MLFDLTYKLDPGEKLVGIARKHWFLIVPKLLELLIIIALLIVFANKFIIKDKFTIIAILTVIYLVYFIYAWILWKIDYYIVTSERIIRVKQPGIWSRKLNEILISDISNITVSEKGMAAMLFKFGSIKIILKNEEIFNLTNIVDSVKFYQGLIKLKEIKKA